MSRIPTQLKLIVLKTVHLALTGLSAFTRVIQKLIRWFMIPVLMLYRIVIRPLALQVYLSLFSSKKLFKHFFKQSHNVWHNLLNQRVTMYALLGTVTLFMIAHNIEARELPPEKLGTDSILYELVAAETIVDTIEDSQLPVIQSNKVPGTDNLAISADERITQEPHTENTTALTQGGTALLAAGQTETPHTRTSVESYTVQSGDTVTSIAKQFGISINSILWANDLSRYSLIRPGDNLKILPTSGLLHEVSSGDTVSSLAQKYQTEEEDIIAANNLEGNNLAVGVELIIPGGIVPTPVIARTTPQTTVTTFIRPSEDVPEAVDSGASLLWPGQSHRINQYWSWRHTGIDINGDWGDPIYASEDGKVEISGWNNNGYGNYIIINHGNGIKTLYAHNSKNEVAVDDTVSRGDLIGYIGSTGRSTGPHIHYEVRVNGRRVNPLLYTK